MRALGLAAVMIPAQVVCGGCSLSESTARLKLETRRPRPSAVLSAFLRNAPEPSRCPGGEVFVPATGDEGFVMGRRGSADARAHRVVLTRPFCVDATEVTVASYEACVRVGACEVPRLWGVWINYPKKGRHPMNKVSWKQARSLCVHLGKDLPTEAQWEWAATGGDERKWAWGDEKPTCAHADFTPGVLTGPSSDDGCHGGGTSEVGTHAAGDRLWNGERVHDLSGNVWEWVLDNHAPYPAEAQRDPLVLPNEDGAHVVRGGGWNRSGRGITVRYRGVAPVGYRVPGLGFRCVRALER